MKKFFGKLICTVLPVSCLFSSDKYDAFSVFETVEVLVSSEVAGSF
jgi:hypothetical protein